MSPHSSRLPKEEFASRDFRIARTPYFSLRTKKNIVRKKRIGVIIGKAVHKSAVKRNFWRRQAKAIAANLVPPGNDLLVIFSPKIKELTKREFQESLARSVATFHLSSPKI